MDQFTEIRTWAEISRSALRHNLNVAKELTGGTKIMCVIKGNAHGHGAVECGRTLEQAGADAFAVASLEEAVPCSATMTSSSPDWIWNTFGN